MSSKRRRWKAKARRRQNQLVQQKGPRYRIIQHSEPLFGRATERAMLSNHRSLLRYDANYRKSWRKGMRAFADRIDDQIIADVCAELFEGGSRLYGRCEPVRTIDAVDPVDGIVAP